MSSLPYNMSLMPQMMPSPNIPVQTSLNNFQTFQQPQMVTQQMQTNPPAPFSTNLQDNFKQPFYQLHQADVFLANQQYAPNIISARNPCPPFFQTPTNLQPPIQTQPSYAPLPQNLLDQIRNCVSGAAPIFILPGSCQQTANQQQPNLTNQGGAIQHTGPSTGVNCPPSIYCPPSFYPYPIPMPVFEPFGTQARGKDGGGGCSCCRKRQHTLDAKNCPLNNCCCNIHEPEEHCCTATTDDTICSKRNCPASISLQALASQFLTLPGIISCAATRLILRKVAGSNITSTMEDTMNRAQNSIGGLTKDQLLAESRNAQQVNALINLHMTTNPPANIVPLLTLVQVKVNVLKAQVECLINKKVMECQGYGYEVETSSPIDPTVLAMKTNAELRQLVSALRQKECDERVNVNFSPYHSQRAIAEARLNNVQAKIRQVEGEFDRRRGISVPAPTLTSRVVQQFTESRCTFGYAHANLFEPYVQGSALESPDPFAQSARNPRRLYLKPRDSAQPPWPQKQQNTCVSTCEDGTSMCKDTGTGEGNVNCSTEKAVESRHSAGNCSCTGTSSEDSFDEDKKKLRTKIDRRGTIEMSSVDRPRDLSLLKLVSNAVTRIGDASGEDGTETEIKVDGPEKEDGERRDGRKIEERVDKGVESEDDDAEISGNRLSDIKKEDGDSDELGKSIAIKQKNDDDTVHRTIGTGETHIKSDPDIKKEIKIEATVKTEPASQVIEVKSFDLENIRIKQEPEDYSRDDDKRSKVEPLNNAEVEEQITDDVIIVAKKPIVIDIATPGESETELPVKQLGATNEEKKDVQNTASSSLSSWYKKYKADRRNNGKGLKSTGGNVSKNRETESGVPENSQTSGLHGETTSSILFKQSTDKVGTTQQKTKKDSNKRIKSEADESSIKKEKEKHVQFISMMTRVEYNRQFVDFRDWDTYSNCGMSINDAETENRRENDGKDDSSSSFAIIDVPDESNEDSVSEKENHSTVSTSQQCEHIGNVILDKIFAENRRREDGRRENRTSRFPPLKCTSPKTRGATAGISENIFHEIEIGSGSLKAVCDRSTSYHCDSETGNSIVSSIYSMIENQIVSISSFLNKIPSLQSVLSNFHCDQCSSNNNENNFPPFERRTTEKSGNKNVRNENDDWIFLPINANTIDDDGCEIFDEHNVSIRKECNGIRKLRHSIIVDEETRKCLLIRGSSSVQLRELSRNGFEQPYQSRKSLVIRSRLKSPGLSQHDRSDPFTILKRPKVRKLLVPRAKKRTVRELNGDEKSQPLHETPTVTETSRTAINYSDRTDGNDKDLNKIEEEFA